MRPNNCQQLLVTKVANVKKRLSARGGNSTRLIAASGGLPPKWDAAGLVVSTEWGAGDSKAQKGSYVLRKQLNKVKINIGPTIEPTVSSLHKQQGL